MSRVFVDASVLFAAAYSFRGAANDLIRLGLAGKVNLVLSEDVITEVERNLSEKYPEKLSALDFFLNHAAIERVISPTTEEVQAAATYTVLKDAPIVAAAIKGQCVYLATYDRKHLRT